MVRVRRTPDQVSRTPVRMSRTTTQAGLKVRAEIDTREYPPGRKITRHEVRRVKLSCDSFHGEWNYTVQPAEAAETETLIS